MLADELLLCFFEIFPIIVNFETQPEVEAANSYKAKEKQHIRVLWHLFSKEKYWCAILLYIGMCRGYIP